MEVYEYRLEEITQMIKDNLILLYKYNDYALIELKKHCNGFKEIMKINQDELTKYTEEALTDLIKVDFLFDLRDIE